VVILLQIDLCGSEWVTIVLFVGYLLVIRVGAV